MKPYLQEIIDKYKFKPNKKSKIIPIRGIGFSKMVSKKRTKRLEKLRLQKLRGLERIAKRKEMWGEKYQLKRLSRSEYAKEYRKIEKNYFKINATKKVYSAVRNGTLIRGICHCGSTKVEGHHEDYKKPLEVIWLCKKHHAEADKNRRKREQDEKKILCDIFSSLS